MTSVPSSSLSSSSVFSSSVSTSSVFSSSVTEHSVQTDGHITFYRASGPDTGTPIVFVHGWPELSRSWRHQITAFGALGFRCIAPDLRGYGRSTVHPEHADYALENLVGDMIGLVDELGIDRAIWVGHDWGSPVVWSIASHHPDRCHGVASLCVPYRTLDLGLDAVIALVNRDRYPDDAFPAGQWEYMRYYEESFDDARRFFEANPRNTIKLLFRGGDPSGFGRPAATARTRIDGGWGGGLAEAPEVPHDPEVLTEDDLDEYAHHLERNGFFGPDSYYMNHERNAAYGANVENPTLQMPVLFLHAQYDYVCDTVTSELADPMREHCSDLTEETVFSGHWMAQERPRDVNAVLARWLAAKFDSLWLRSTPATGAG